MTRKEAIKEIEYLIGDGVVLEHIVVNLPQKSIEALKLAKEELIKRTSYENCILCKGDKNFKINFISGMNCTSNFSTFDLGTVENIHCCPVCGRYLD